MVCGYWQWNAIHGPPWVQGWLFVQGPWSWGLVVTWHIEEVLDQPYWVGLQWQWRFSDEWEISHFVSMSEQRRHVEDWMVHTGVTLANVHVEDA